MKTTDNITQNSSSKAVANIVKVNQQNQSSVELLQPKLNIRKPADNYEVKADNATDKKIQLSESIIQHQELEKEELNIQKKPFLKKPPNGGKHSEISSIISQSPLNIQKEATSSGGQQPFRIALQDFDVVNPKSEVITTVREAFEPIVTEANRSLEIIEGGTGDLMVLFSNHTVQSGGSCGRTRFGNEAGQVWVGSHLAVSVCCDPGVESCRYPNLNLFVGEGTQLGRFIGNTAVHELAHQLGVDHNDTDSGNYMYNSDTIPIPAETRTLENMRAYFSQHLTFSSSQTFQMMLNISRNNIPGGVGFVQNQGEHEETTAPDIQEKSLNGSEFIQSRLKTGKPGDKYEQEAERTADSIMSMPEPVVQNQLEEEEEIVQTKPFIQTQSLEEEESLQTKWIQREAGKEEEREIQDETIQRQEEEEELIQPKSFLQTQPVKEEELIQSKNNNGDGQAATPWIESQISSSSGKGTHLSANTKSFMENRFGSDFSDVRIHTNSSAIEMNQQMGAQAFTVGRDIYFNSAKYSPESSSGKHLLAHELTHVIQQGATASLKKKSNRKKKTGRIKLNNHSVSKNPENIQRGVLDDLRALGSAIMNVVTTIAGVLNMGIAAALSWIRGIAGLLGSSIVTAWEWITNVARIIGVGARTAFSWVRNLSRVIGLGAREAFNWIQIISQQIGMGVRLALTWLTNISNLISSGIREAYLWIRNVVYTIGLGFRPSWSWILSVAQHIGQGIRSAWNWVTNMALIIGLGIRAAWRWVRNLSLRLIGMGIAAAFRWIIEVAARLTLGILNAFAWLVNLTRMLQSTLQIAWNFIVQVSSILVIDILNTLVWLRRVGQSIGRSLRIAWEIIQRIASFIGRSVRRAWDWIREVAGRIGRRILAAWEWIQNAARTLGRSIVRVWNFLKALARRVRNSIQRAWRWIQSKLPVVIIGSFRNSGSTSSKNLCTLCPQTLGPSTTSGTNGMELKGTIIGHNPLFSYDFKRTKERATWKKVGGTWTQLTHVGPGADDDSHNQDEDLLPDGNQIFVIDTPGFRNKNNPVGDNSASEAVYKASFIETVKVLKPGEAWRTSSNSVSWHSISWFEKVGGSWRRKARSNEIETGSTTIGSGDP